jgi:hypothetical protein
VNPRCACGVWPDWEDEYQAANGIVCFECGVFECVTCRTQNTVPPVASDWDPAWCSACNILGDAVALAASK